MHLEGENEALRDGGMRSHRHDALPRHPVEQMQRKVGRGRAPLPARARD